MSSTGASVPKTPLPSASTDIINLSNMGLSTRELSEAASLQRIFAGHQRPGSAAVAASVTLLLNNNNLNSLPIQIVPYLEQLKVETLDLRNNPFGPLRASVLPTLCRLSTLKHLYLNIGGSTEDEDEIIVTLTSLESFNGTPLTEVLSHVPQQVRISVKQDTALPLQYTAEILKPQFTLQELEQQSPKWPQALLELKEWYESNIIDSDLFRSESPLPWTQLLAAAISEQQPQIHALMHLYYVLYQAMDYIMFEYLIPSTSLKAQELIQSFRELQHRLLLQNHTASMSSSLNAFSKELQMADVEIQKLLDASIMLEQALSQQQQANEENALVRRVMAGRYESQIEQLNEEIMNLKLLQVQQQQQQQQQQQARTVASGKRSTASKQASSLPTQKRSNTYASSNTQRALSAPGPNAVQASPRGATAASPSPSAASARQVPTYSIYPLGQLQDMIHDIYDQYKKKYPLGGRQTQTSSATRDLTGVKPSLRSFLYQYLTHRYGSFKQIILHHTLSIIYSIKQYQEVSGDVLLFQYILKNECDLEFVEVHQQLQKTVKNIYDMILAHSPQLQSQQTHTLDSEVWIQIVKYIYNKQDALTAMQWLLKRYGQGQDTASVASTKISYQQFIHVLEEYQIYGHVRYVSGVSKMCKTAQQNCPCSTQIARDDDPDDGIICTKTTSDDRVESQSCAHSVLEQLRQQLIAQASGEVDGSVQIPTAEDINTVVRTLMDPRDTGYVTICDFISIVCSVMPAALAVASGKGTTQSS